MKKIVIASLIALSSAQAIELNPQMQAYMNELKAQA